MQETTIDINLQRISFLMHNLLEDVVRKDVVVDMVRMIDQPQ